MITRKVERLKLVSSLVRPSLSCSNRAVFSTKLSYPGTFPTAMRGERNDETPQSVCRAAIAILRLTVYYRYNLFITNVALHAQAATLNGSRSWVFDRTSATHLARPPSANRLNPNLTRAPNSILGTGTQTRPQERDPPELCVPQAHYRGTRTFTSIVSVQ